MNKLEVIDIYAARLMMIGFFLPMKWQATSIILACIYFVTKALLQRSQVQLQQILWAVILGSGFLLYIGAIPLTPVADRSVLMLLVGRRMALLLVPIFFAIFIPRYGGVLLRELKFFVYGCIVTCIVANAAFIYQVYFTLHPVMTISHVAYRIFFEAFTGLHPTYISMYLAFAICILLCGFVPLGKLSKFVLLYLLLIFLLALLAKSPLIAVLIIFVHYAYLHRQLLFRYKILITTLLAAVLAGCFFIPFIGQRAGEVLSFFGTKAPGQITDNSVYTRKLIWNTDIGLLKQYWQTGVGPARLLRMLDYRYLFYSISHNSATGYYDPHNEYLWEWLSFGIIGIIITVGLLVVHFIKAIKSKNHLYLYLLLILVITFSTESVLSRQQGILFYAVFTSMFFFYKNDSSKV